MQDVKEKCKRDFLSAYAAELVFLACLPGGQLLEGPCAASAVGCEYGLPAGCYIPMLVRASA